MDHIFSFLRWLSLLTIALFMPISMPVGGAQINLDDVLESNPSYHFIAGSFCEFRSTPCPSSRVLRKVSLGAPIQVLRTWESPEGINWCHVQITSIPLLDVSIQPQKGWIQI